jgi:ATP-binding cassette, sub-family E, member 1
MSEKKAERGRKEDERKAQRVVVVDRDLCKPGKCGLVCRAACPIVRSGDECITYATPQASGQEVAAESSAHPKEMLSQGLAIDEKLCIGCGICVKRCPYGALTVVNLPKELNETPVHRFGRNGFVLYRLPFPTKDQVVGVVGPNGVGKTTALRILSGELKPNFGDWKSRKKETDWSQAIDIFRGTEMQAYFERMEKEGVRTSIKPQRVDEMPMFFHGNVEGLLKTVDERKIVSEMVEGFGLKGILDREMKQLSGGELQRVAIIAALARDADIYYLDEPTSFLDVFQRLRIAKLIRKYCEDRMVMIVDHDLATLDFLADRVHIFYGVQGAYGIVSKPHGVREGINAFLDGYIKEDNVRFREDGITFFGSTTMGRAVSQKYAVKVDNLKKSFGEGKFSLDVKSGEVREKEVLAVLGANALGKTTLARILAGEEKADSGEMSAQVRIAYKPQYIKTEFEGTVADIIGKTLKLDDNLQNEVLLPLGLSKLMDKFVSELSGGELQRVAIALCLGREADMYLLDEPSAFLDVEQRLSLAKLINRIVEVREKSAFVIDHDLLFLSQVGHRGMVFLGEPGVHGEVEKVEDLKDSLNRFLAQVGVTFRKDGQTGRPRANKLGSQLDREQKEKDNYFYI